MVNLSGLERRFNRLVRELERGTAALSSPQQVTSYHAYKKLVRMGKKIIPFVLEKYVDSYSWHYGALLRDISNEDPIPRDHYGKSKWIRDDWLKWGENKGYIKYKNLLAVKKKVRER